MRRQIWAVHAVDHFDFGAFRVLVLDPDVDGSMTADQAIEAAITALGRSSNSVEVGGADRYEESSDAHGVFLSMDPVG